MKCIYASPSARTDWIFMRAQNFPNVTRYLKLLCSAITHFQDWNKKHQGGIIRRFSAVVCLPKAELQMNFHHTGQYFVSARDKFDFHAALFCAKHKYYDTRDCCCSVIVCSIAYLINYVYEKPICAPFWKAKSIIFQTNMPLCFKREWKNKSIK